MLLSPVDPLINKTASALDIPKEVVKKVISHQFKEVADNYKYWKYVGFRFEGLGSLYVSPGAYKKIIQDLLIRSRKDPQSKYREALFNAFKLRHQVKSFHESKKYKKRFGSWHY